MMPTRSHSSKAKLHIISILLMCGSAGGRAQVDPIRGPDCSKGWPTNMTFTYLKNAGLTNNDKVDFSKTRTVRLASERLKPGLRHQVYDVRFTERSGNVIEAIAVHNASSEECSMTDPEIYVVSRRLGAAQ